MIAESGFNVHLFGYQYRVCLNFREVYDSDGKYEKLYYLLNGKGVTSVTEALKEMDLLPLHSRYENFFSFDNMEKIRSYLTFKPDKRKKETEFSLPGKIDNELVSLTKEFHNFVNGRKLEEKVEKRFHNDLSAARNFFQFWVSQNQRKSVTKWIKNVDDILPVNYKLEIDRQYLTLINLILLKQLFIKKTDEEKIDLIFDEILLSKPITNILEKFSNGTSIYHRIQLIKVLLHSFLNEKQASKSKKKNAVKKTVVSKEDNSLPAIKVLLDEELVHNFIHVNEFEGTTYFNKERFEELLKWKMQFDLIETAASIKEEKKDKKPTIAELNKELNKSIKEKSEKYFELLSQAESCGYDFIKFRNQIKSKSDFFKKKAINKKRNKL
jgi:hypothetical protein